MTVKNINHLFKEVDLTKPSPPFYSHLTKHSKKMDFDAYGNLTAEFDDDCFKHHHALNVINEYKEAFIMNKTQQWGGEDGKDLWRSPHSRA